MNGAIIVVGNVMNTPDNVPVVVSCIQNWGNINNEIKEIHEKNDINFLINPPSNVHRPINTSINSKNVCIRTNPIIE
jgi:PII-like signaling protein